MCYVCLAPGMVLGLADPGRREGSLVAHSVQSISRIKGCGSEHKKLQLRQEN